MQDLWGRGPEKEGTEKLNHLCAAKGFARRREEKSLKETCFITLINLLSAREKGQKRGGFFLGKTQGV